MSIFPLHFYRKLLALTFNSSTPPRLLLLIPNKTSPLYVSLRGIPFLQLLQLALPGSFLGLLFLVPLICKVLTRFSDGVGHTVPSGDKLRELVHIIFDVFPGVICVLNEDRCGSHDGEQTFLKVGEVEVNSKFAGGGFTSSRIVHLRHDRRELQ